MNALLAVCMHADGCVQARYHEKWAAKRAVDEQRMAEIREQQAQQEGEAPSEQQD